MRHQLARLANRALDLIYFPGCARLTLPPRRGRVACLLYHRVVTADNDPYSFLTRGGVPAIDPDELSSDLAYLQRNGARFMTFDDIRSGQFPSDNEWGIIVTFDDCFDDNYTLGIQVLSAFGVKAVFFQTSGLIDGQELIWEHQLYWYNRNDKVAARFLVFVNDVLSSVGIAPLANQHELVHKLREQIPFAVTAYILKEASAEAALNVPAPMSPGGLYPTADQIRSARRAGHEIAAHGHLHLKRANIPAALFLSDLVRSKAVLTGILGHAPASYSFPFSNFGPQDIDTCRMHFDVVATVERKRLIERPTDRFLAPRFTWPGPARNRFRKRRWLLTGTI
jgi:peptidoglycan/xylan/chitin deacetylase (PgdA/CDA1 family)